jgi:hypothetical protein
MILQNEQERPMAEEDHSPTAEAQPGQPLSGVEDRPRTEGPDSSAGPGPPEEPQESKASRLLREAIHQIMEEIEHHEQEAQRHLQQAQALRKELRESLAFLRAEGRKGQTAEPPGGTSEQGTEAKGQEVAAAPKGPRAGSKKPSGKTAKGK